MDYVLNVFKENEFLYAIGGNYMNYDNVIWWQLEELINVVNNNESLTPDELLKLIQDKCDYFTIVLNEEQKNEPVLDLTNKTIGINHMNLFDFDEVTFSNVGRKLINVTGELKIEYEYTDEEPFDVTHINFDLDLLNKKTLKYNELITVAGFINDLINKSESDLIINNEKALLLTSI